MLGRRVSRAHRSHASSGRNALQFQRASTDKGTLPSRPRRSMSPFAALRPRIARLAVALVLAVLAAMAFERLHIPIPWMLGPLVSLGIANLLGNSLEPIPYGRQVGQVFIGTGVGLYFTPT